MADPAERIHPEIYPKAEAFLRENGLHPAVGVERIMVGEALERGLNVSLSSEGKILFRDRYGRAYTLRNSTNSFNIRLARLVMKQKDVISSLLTTFGVPTTENAVFGEDEVERAWAWAMPLGTLVVKPAAGTNGRNVHIGITTREEFQRAFEDVAGTFTGRILVEKFYTGVEHRCLTLKGKLIAVTRRRPSSVLGDGVSTVRELVEQKNLDRGPIHIDLTLDEEALTLLGERGLTVDSIPAAGDRVYLKRASNIKNGGDAIDATNDLTPEQIALVERAAKVLPNAPLIGMDVLMGVNPGDPVARILEMNGGPMISMHHFPWEGEPRNVASAILDAMFPKAPLRTPLHRRVLRRVARAFSRATTGWRRA